MRFSSRTVWLALSLLLTKAQADNCTSTPESPSLITSQEDADFLSNCTTHEGPIRISTNATSITLPGVEEIWGALIISESTSLQNFTAPSLKTVNDFFGLRNLPVLSEVNLPVFQGTPGIAWENLPLLEEISFPDQQNYPQEMSEEASALDVEIHNTGLRQLNLSPYGGSVNVSGNTNLSLIDFGDSTEIERIYIASNGPSATLNLGSLTGLASLMIEGISSVNVSSLQQVVIDIVLQNNSFAQFSCPKLEFTRGNSFSLNITGNQNLTTIDFPSLHILNNLTIQDNPALQVVDGFSVLNNITGDVLLTGNFSSVSIPNLKSVDSVAGFYIDSENANFDCSEFDKFESELEDHPGNYTCRASASASGIDTATHHNSGSTLSTGAIFGIVIGAVVAVIL